MSLVEESQKNQFASYAIKNPEDEKGDDVIEIQQLLGRIESSYKDSKDQMYLEKYFKLVDTDEDGVISYEDLKSHLDELGLEKCMSEQIFNEFSEKLNHQTMAIGKTEFIEIVKPYL